MRLPLIPDVDSRDGSSNKDARLTNCLAEQDDNGPVATLRPGLSTIATASGNGNGATNFDAVLITVYGTTLGFGTTPTTIGTVAAGTYDFCQSPI